MTEGATNSIGGISLELALDTSQFDAAVEAAQSKLSALGAGGSSLGVAPRRGGAAGIVDMGGGPAPAARVQPVFAVNRDTVHGMSVDINRHLRALTAQSGGVKVPVSLGRSNWTQIRSEISRNIGTVPITVQLGGAGRGGGSSSVSMGDMFAGVVAAIRGTSLPEGRAFLRTGLAERGVAATPRRLGGPVYPGTRYLVGEKEPEVVEVTQPGRVIPRVRGAEMRPWRNAPSRDERMVERAERDRLRYENEQLTRELEAGRSAMDIDIPHARRGRGVRGYRGRLSAPPASSRSHAEYQDQLWGSPYPDQGYAYHQTDALRSIREGSYKGTGVRPNVTTSFWTRGGAPLARSHMSVPSMRLLRTPLDRRFYDSEGNFYGDPGFGGGYLQTGHVIPRRELQYWGGDNRWHGFRRGRTRPVRRQNGGRAYDIDTVERPHELHELRDFFPNATIRLNAGNLDRYFMGNAARELENAWLEPVLEAVTVLGQGKYPGDPRGKSGRGVAAWAESMGKGKTGIFYHGTPEKYGSYNTELLIHELGHAAQNLLEWDPNEKRMIRPPALETLMKIRGGLGNGPVGPSSYGLIDEPEFFAEAFARYVMRRSWEPYPSSYKDQREPGAVSQQLAFAERQRVTNQWMRHVLPEALVDPSKRSAQTPVIPIYPANPEYWQNADKWDNTDLGDPKRPRPWLHWDLASVMRWRRENAPEGWWEKRQLGGAVHGSRLPATWQAYGHEISRATVRPFLRNYEAMADYALSEHGDISSFAGNIWYPGRRRHLLNEALAAGALPTAGLNIGRGGTPRSGFGPFLHAARSVIPAAAAASPGLFDYKAVAWARYLARAAADPAYLAQILQQADPSAVDVVLRGVKRKSIPRELAAMSVMSEPLRGEKLSAGRYGWEGIEKGWRIARGEDWRQILANSDKVLPFNRNIYGNEHIRTIDSHDFDIAGGGTSLGFRLPETKYGNLGPTKAYPQGRPSAARAHVLEAARLSQEAHADVWPTTRRHQAGLWVPHFPITGQPIEASLTGIVVPKGWRKKLPAGWKLGAGGLLEPKEEGGPVHAMGGRRVKSEATLIREFQLKKHSAGEHENLPYFNADCPACSTSRMAKEMGWTDYEPYIPKYLKRKPKRAAAGVFVSGMRPSLGHPTTVAGAQRIFNREPRLQFLEREMPGLLTTAGYPVRKTTSLFGGYLGDIERSSHLQAGPMDLRHLRQMAALAGRQGQPGSEQQEATLLAIFGKEAMADLGVGPNGLGYVSNFAARNLKDLEQARRAIVDQSLAGGFSMTMPEAGHSRLIFTLRQHEIDELGGGAETERRMRELGLAIGSPFRRRPAHIEAFERRVGDAPYLAPTGSYGQIGRGAGPQMQAAQRLIHQRAMRRMAGGPVGVDWRTQPDWRDAKRVEMVSVESLLPIRELDREVHPRFAHDFGYLDELTEKIRTEGFSANHPIVVHYDPFHHAALVSDGNHRLAVARRLGMEKVPVVVSVQQHAMPKFKGHRMPGESSIKPDETGYIPGMLPPSWIGLKRDGGPVWRRLLEAPYNRTMTMGRRAAASYNRRASGFRRAGLTQDIPPELLEGEAFGIEGIEPIPGPGSKAFTNLRRMAQIERHPDVVARIRNEPRFADLFEALGILKPPPSPASLRRSETERRARIQGVSDYMSNVVLQNAVRRDRLDQMKRFGVTDETLNTLGWMTVMGGGQPPKVQSGDPQYRLNPAVILLNDKLSAGFFNKSTAAVWGDIDAALERLPTDMGPLGRRMPTSPYRIGWDQGRTGAIERNRDRPVRAGQEVAYYDRPDRFGVKYYRHHTMTEDDLRFNDPTRWTEAGYSTTLGMLKGRRNQQGGPVHAARGTLTGRVNRDIVGRPINYWTDPGIGYRTFFATGKQANPWLPWVDWPRDPRRDDKAGLPLLRPDARLIGPGSEYEPTITGRQMEEILRRYALAGGEKALRRHQSGGPAPHGLYIVNEAGKEGFVTATDAAKGLIPPHVMAQIPHARDGAKTGMINKPAWSLFTPERDGWIIPAHLVKEVPALRGARYAAGGASTPGISKRTLESIIKAGSSADPSGGVIGKAVDERMKAGIEEQANLTIALMREGMIGAAAMMPTRTGRGSASALGVMSPLGGKRGQMMAQARAAEATSVYQATVKEAAPFIAARPTIELARQEAAAQRESIRMQKEAVKFQRDTFAKGSDEWEGLDITFRRLSNEGRTLTRRITGLDTVFGETIDWENQLNSTRENMLKLSKAAQPGMAGAARSLLAGAVSVQAYGLIAQAASVAMGEMIRAGKPFVDSLMGFTAANQQVTKTIAGSILEAGGNLDATFGELGVAARLSGEYADFLKRTIGESAQIKAGGQTMGQTSQLFRATIGQGAPTGLYGGYGGILGSGLGAELMGGGKGFTEQIAGDIGAFTGPRVPNPAEDLNRSLAFLSNKDLRNYVLDQAKAQGNPLGAAGDIAGVFGDVMRTPGNLVGGFGKGPLETLGAVAAAPLALPSMAFGALFPKAPSPAEGRGAGGPAPWINPAVVGKTAGEMDNLTAYLNDLQAAGKRGASSVGDTVTGFYRLATSQKEIADATALAVQAGDLYGVQMAQQGIVLAKNERAIIDSAEAYKKANTEMARGKTLVDPGVWIKTQQQTIRAQEEAARVQRDYAVETRIPAQLGEQLAAQPFVAARTGVLPTEGSAFLGGSGGQVRGYLREAQATQNQLEQEGRAAIEAQARWIEEQAKGNKALQGAGDEYRDFMGVVTTSGQTIAKLQTDIANAQTNANMKAYANNVRLANRAIADAKGLAGQGGSRYGQLQREQTMLGFGLQQRAITTQIALANFQAPGETGEERFARREEELTKAKIAQRQLNIGKQMFGIEAGRGVTDTGAAKAVMQASHEAAMVAAAASKQIAAEQMKQSQAMSKASQIVQQAEGTFSGRLSSASAYVAQFGGTVAEAAKAIRTAFGIPEPRERRGGRASGGPVFPNQTYTVGEKGRETLVMGASGGYVYPYARGVVGMAKGPTRALIGEAGDEAVAILRNPRASDLGMGKGEGGGGGPSGDFTVNLNINASVRGDNDIQAIANAVERVLGKKAQLLGYRSPSY